MGLKDVCCCTLCCTVCLFINGMMVVTQQKSLYNFAIKIIAEVKGKRLWGNYKNVHNFVVGSSYMALLSTSLYVVYLHRFNI